MNEARKDMLKEAMGQAVLGVTGPQQEEAAGANGWKTTLLAWVIKNGPFAGFSVILSVALYAVAAAYVESTDRSIAASEEDRELARAMVKSNMLLAHAVESLVVVTEKGNTTSREILGEFREFTIGVDRDHLEQTRMLRQIPRQQNLKGITP